MGMMKAQITSKYGWRIIGLLLLGQVATARAQEAWTVDSCMRYAIEKNLTLKNSRLDSRIAREDVTAAIGDFLPSVGTSGTFGKRMGRSVDPKTNMYTTSSFLESTVGIDISLPVFDGFKRINRAQFARLNRRLSGVAEKAEENRVAFEVMDACYVYLFDREMSALAAEQRKLSERYREQMVELVDLGLRSPSDLQEVKARLQSDIYQETVKNKTERLSLLALKELLQMRDGDALVLDDIGADGQALPLTATCSAAELYAESENVLPEFRMMDLREKAGRKSLAVASGAFSPSIRADFSLYSNYYDTERDADGHIVGFGKQMKNNWNKYIGLRVSFPLFSGLSRITAVRKERFRLQQIRNENDRQRLSLYKDIEDACLTLQASVEEYRQAKLQLEAATTILKENEEKWEEGMVSVFELMEQRNLYISAKAELARTWLQYHLKRRMVGFYRSGSFITFPFCDDDFAL